MTWVELCHDKRFQDLPYRIELDRLGRIIMSPTRARHGQRQNQIARLLEAHLPDGEVIVELAIETEDSTKVADVVWASDAVWTAIQDEYSATVCPEICVEVLSPSNTEEEMTEKRRLYFAAGAKECWTCDEFGHLRFYSPAGRLERSALCPEFPAVIPA